MSDLGYLSHQVCRPTHMGIEKGLGPNGEIAFPCWFDGASATIFKTEIRRMPSEFLYRLAWQVTAVHPVQVDNGIIAEVKRVAPALAYLLLAGRKPIEALWWYVTDQDRFTSESWPRCNSLDADSLNLHHQRMMAAAVEILTASTNLNGNPMPLPARYNGYFASLSRKA